jgi:D-proline reductase (dithiol) PrdB
VPVLARSFEAEGISTILITNMPYWAQKIGVPRCLAVEYPFGHTLGQPGDIQGQRAIIDEALAVLEAAEGPGTIVHSQATWPEAPEQALLNWQPEEPSPIVRVLLPRIKDILRERRGKAKS